MAVSRIAFRPLLATAHAVLSLYRAWQHSVWSIGLLALGIAPALTLLVITDSLVYRKLPVPNPDDLVILRRVTATETYATFEYPFYEALRADQRALQGLAAIGELSGAQLRLGPSVVALRDSKVRLVSRDYFDVLGLRPFLGTFFDGDASGDRRLAVISHRFWRANAPEDASLIGAILTVNQVDFRIVAVVPQSFADIYPGDITDVWLPVDLQPELEALDQLSGNTAWLNVVGRLARGNATQESAAAHLSRVLDSIGNAGLFGVNARGKLRIHLESAATGIRDPDHRYPAVLPLLLAVSSLLLLAAISGAGTLLAARLVRQRREFAVREALGASRPFLVGQTLAEIFTLVAIATFVGGIIAPVLIRAFVKVTSEIGGNAMYVAGSIDRRYAILSMLVGSSTAILLAFLAVVRLSEEQYNARLFRTASVISGSSEGVTFKVLVALQVAVSISLLFAMTLMLRTIVNMYRVNPGWDATNAFVVRLPLSSDAMSLGRDDPRGTAVLDALESLPAVTAATAGTGDPLNRISNYARVRALQPPERDLERVRISRVGRGYFETLSLQMLRGEPLSGDEPNGGPRVAVVNRLAAEQLWQNPFDGVGRTIALVSSVVSTPITIKGIVENVRHGGVRQDLEPELFFPLSQLPGPVFSIIIRSESSAALVEAQVRQVFGEVGLSALEHVPVVSLTDEVHQHLTRERTVLQAAAISGGLSVLITVVNLYGLVSWLISRRAPEIAMRLALGATYNKIGAALHREALLVVLMGVVAGIAVGLGINRLLYSVLFGVSPTDAVSLAGAIVLMVAASVAATHVSIRRIRRINLSILLRSE